MGEAFEEAPNHKVAKSSGEWIETMVRIAKDLDRDIASRRNEIHPGLKREG